MDTTLLIAIVVIVLIYLVARSRTRAPRQPMETPVAKPSPEVVYQGLRNMILHGSRARFNLPPAKTPTEPWGVVMDWGVTNGTATVSALSDGSASIYLSGGGGYLGGQGKEPIRNAALAAVAVAAEFGSLMKITTEYSLPISGEVIFYVLTDSGTLTTSAREEDLRNQAHPLLKLGNAMQNIITQYRILEDWKK